MLESLFKQVQEKMTFRKEATVFGVRFTFTLLSAEEDRKIMEHRAAWGQGESNPDDFIALYSDVVKKTLAYVIRAVDGNEIPDVIEIEKEDGSRTTVERSVYLRSFLDTMPKTMVDKMFDVFTDFKKEMDTKFDEELEYDWFESPEERAKEEEGEQKETKESSDDGEEKVSGNEEKGLEFKVIDDGSQDSPEDGPQV